MILFKRIALSLTPTQGITHTTEDLITLFGKATHIIGQEPSTRPLNRQGTPGNLVQLGSQKRVGVVGDLHANNRNLVQILADKEISTGLEQGNLHLLFLGDYLHSNTDPHDSESSLQLIIRLAQLGIRYPKNTTFLKGNHDSLSENVIKKGHLIGFYFNQYIRQTFGDELLSSIGSFLKNLPVMAVGTNFIAVHASAPPRDLSVEKIINLNTHSKDYQHMMTFRKVSSEDIEKCCSLFKLPNSPYFITGHHWLRDDKSFTRHQTNKYSFISLQSHKEAPFEILMMEEGRDSFQLIK